MVHCLRGMHRYRHRNIDRKRQGQRRKMQGGQMGKEVVTETDWDPLRQGMRNKQRRTEEDRPGRKRDRGVHM